MTLTPCRVRVAAAPLAAQMKPPTPLTAGAVRAAGSGRIARARRARTLRANAIRCEARSLARRDDAHYVTTGTTVELYFPDRNAGRYGNATRDVKAGRRALRACRRNDARSRRRQTATVVTPYVSVHMTGPLSGWIALALRSADRTRAWALRRFVRGAFVRRMRPHFVLGYAALAIALVHMWTSMGGMQGAKHDRHLACDAGAARARILRRSSVDQPAVAAARSPASPLRSAWHLTHVCRSCRCLATRRTSRSNCSLLALPQVCA